MTVGLYCKAEWILGRMASELVTGLPEVRFTLPPAWPPSARPLPVDVHYFLPEKNVRYLQEPRAGLSVGYFTHGEERARAYWSAFDVCLTMNQRTADRLRELGARDVRVIRPGTEPPVRPARFGVVARVVEAKGVKGRKGLDLVAAVVKAGYDVRACSPSPRTLWPCPVTHTPEVRDAFYRSIDYLLITSTEEGGPMPLLEALARHIPVIAPSGVGWCDEFPTLTYEAGNPRALLRLLERLQPPTWASWVEAHRTLFADLEARRVA